MNAGSIGGAGCISLSSWGRYGLNVCLDRQPYVQKMLRILIYEIAIHWIDTFRYLLEESESVYADLCLMNGVIVGEHAGLITFSIVLQSRENIFLVGNNLSARFGSA